MRRSLRRQADDTVPYDRDQIRSGGVSARRTSRSDGPRGARPSRRPGAGTSRPRRRGSIGRTLGIIALLVLLAVIVVGVLIGLRAAAFNATVSSATFPSTALLGPLNGSDRVNVLMVGYGGGDHDGAYLADSIQIMSVDPATDTTTTIPIPRDLWIEGVAAFPQNGKVNTVFSAGHAAGGLDGAAQLLADVLGDVTGLTIDHALSIDFDGFRDMVDSIGGVTVDNPTAFAYTNTEARHRAGDWNVGSFDAGELQMDGDEALAYSRARFTSVVAESTDFARSVRQARVLGAMRAELGAGGISSILPGLRLMDALEGRVRTDLSAIDLFLLSSHLSSDRRIELSEGIVLTATTNTIGQYILIPTDWTGPGSYGGVRSHLARELDRPPDSSIDAP